MTLTTLAEDVVGGVSRTLLIVCGAVAILFLIALANASGLILTRLDDRRQEMGIRIALGARFAHLFRGFAVESLVLTAAAVIPAVILAYLLSRFLLRSHGESIPRLNALAMDQWVLLFVAAAGLVIVLVFAATSSTRIARAVWPRRALAASAPVQAGGLRPGVGRRLLAGGQIAFTVALTVGAAFLISSYRNVTSLELGFDTRGVLLTDLTLPPPRYQEPARVNGFFTQLVERTRALPGVQSAALVAFVPLETPTELWPVEVQGMAYDGGPARPGKGGAAEGVDGQVVSEGFFQTVGMTVRSGRDFRRTDAAAAPVVVVDEAFVKERFGGQDPLGRNVRLALAPNAPWATVVGVVSDARHASVTDPARPHVYFLYDHIPQFAGVAIRSLQVAVKTPGDPDALAAPVRGTIRSIDPELALGRVRTFDSVLAQATSRFRFPMQLLGIFALMALVVSLSGIYGVISQTVTGSTRELGIRMALGAAPARITAFVLRQGLLITVPAVVLGLVAAVALARVSAHLFYGITAGSVMVYVVVGLGVIAAATLACLLPARRAARLQPTAAIREGV
jgi:predicted permease